MGHGKKRISYWIDRRLTGLAGPEYHAIISFGLPIEPEDSQYGVGRASDGTGHFVVATRPLPAGGYRVFYLARSAMAI